MSEKRFWASTPRKLSETWEEYLRLTGQIKDDPKEENVVYRNGKAYKKTYANNAKWADGLF